MESNPVSKLTGCKLGIRPPFRSTRDLQAPENKDIEEFERMVMEGCDANGDGKINKKELTTVLLALAKHAADESRQQK